MYTAFTLLLLVAQALAIGVPLGAGGQLAVAATTTLGSGTICSAVVHAPSKTSRNTRTPMMAARMPRASRGVTRMAAPARPHNAESRRAVVSRRARSAPPPPTVLRI
jgi:hypothetical protein